MKQTVSVVVPMYNAEQSIKKCVQSILVQTYDALEIILVSDGSTDRTMELCEELMQQDSRILLMEQENRGVNAARYTGYKKSTGKYITFVDADDWIDKDMIAGLYEIAEKESADIVRCSYALEYSQSHVDIISGITAGEVLFEEQIRNYLLFKFLSGYRLNTIWGQLILKDAVQDVFFEKTQNLSITEDALFNLYLYLHIKRFYFLESPLYHYRYFGTDSLTSHKNYEKLERNLMDCFTANEMIYEEIKKRHAGYVLLAASKLIIEMEVLIEKLYQADLEETQETKRRELVSSLLQKNFFKSIREQYSFEQVHLMSAHPAVGKMIYDNDTEGIEHLLL